MARTRTSDWYWPGSLLPRVSHGHTYKKLGKKKTKTAAKKNKASERRYTEQRKKQQTQVRMAHNITQGTRLKHHKNKVKTTSDGFEWQRSLYGEW